MNFTDSMVLFAVPMALHMGINPILMGAMAILGAVGGTASPIALTGIIVDGINNLEVKLARCCSPLQGEKIVGFTTMGHGITIHTQQCRKYQEALAKNDPAEMQRWVAATWASNAPAAEMKANIEILCVNSMNLLNDVSQVIGEAHLPVSNFNLHMKKDGNAMIHATVSVSSAEQLDTLLNRLRTVRDVISADRAAY